MVLIIDNYDSFTYNLFQMIGAIEPDMKVVRNDAVSIQEVTYNNEKWNFRELRRIYSPHPDMDLGFHTFNEYNGFIVVDAVGYRKPMLCRFIRKMKQLLC